MIKCVDFILFFILIVKMEIVENVIYIIFLMILSEVIIWCVIFSLEVLVVFVINVVVIIVFF